MAMGGFSMFHDCSKSHKKMHLFLLENLSMTSISSRTRRAPRLSTYRSRRLVGCRDRIQNHQQKVFHQKRILLLKVLRGACLELFEHGAYCHQQSFDGLHRSMDAVHEHDCSCPCPVFLQCFFQKTT